MSLKYSKWIDQNIPSMEGKIVVITGANSGIGFYSALTLAKKGAHIVMACRSEKRALDAKAKILAEAPNARIDYLEYDQASFASIHHFAKEIRLNYPRIDVLVLNAGIYHPKEKCLTKDRYPLIIGTNYFGTFELLDSLDSYFSSLDSYRVIVVGSCITKIPRDWYYFNFFKSNKYSKSYQYRVSKMAVMKLGVYYGLHSETDHKYLLMDPGASSTNIIQGFPKWFQTIGLAFMKLVFHSPLKASLGISMLASSPNVNNLDYYRPRGLFHISGYPKKVKITKRIANYVDDYYINTRRFVKKEL